MNMSILPYVIYDNFEPFNLVLLVNGVAMILLIFVRFKGKPKSIKSLFRFVPLKIFFLLLFFQFLSGVVKLDIVYIGAPIIFSFNFIVFLYYILNIFEQYKIFNKLDFVAFTKGNSFYIIFALFNITIVILSAFLQIFGVLVPFSNSINHLFPNLLISNIVEGSTFYYMPGWLSIQTLDSRLGFIFGTLTGWTHEPHVFAYLVFPSLFLLLAQYYNDKSKSIIIILCFTIAGIFSFSVTALLSITVVLLIKFFVDKNYLIVTTIFLIFLIFSLYSYQMEILDTIWDYTLLKLNYNTSSLEYSTNKISNILFPKSFFGDGVLLLNKSNYKNAGAFASILYLLFYFSLFKSVFKIIFSKLQQNTYIGFAFLYFILHGLKLSSSVFAMPYTAYFLGIMAVYHVNFTKKR
ncbi:MAG: hypothetical protein IPM32_16915 [Ignavibacteriae bacterium]|nr:hypothetical protein [Ignavibacteriota bacterium]